MLRIAVVEDDAALLLNENGALPLAEGSKVSTLSTSSVNMVYGGTGSGNVDASKADSLKVALEKSGLVVNETLWDFYLTGARMREIQAVNAVRKDAIASGMSLKEAMATWQTIDQVPAEYLNMGKKKD